MKANAWNLFLLHLLLGYEVKCKETESCHGSISIECNDYVIAIINATRSHALRLLQQCNARHRCNVSIGSDECVHVSYWCRMDITNLEMKDSSSMYVKIKESSIGLMSKDYSKGSFQSAMNINCNLTFPKDALGAEKNVSFILYDFASFASSTDFCLSMEEFTRQLICSGSQSYYAIHGPFNMTDIKNFSITLRSTAMKSAHGRQYRFWFDIEVSPKGIYLDQMECQSTPVHDGNLGPITTAELSKMETVPDESLKTNTVVVISSSVSVLGTLLLITVVTLIVVIVRSQRQNKYQFNKDANTGVQPANTDEEYSYAYTYIDAGSLDFPLTLNRKKDDHPSIPTVMVETDAVSQASAGNWNTVQSCLSMKLPMNNEIFPEAVNNEQHDLVAPYAVSPMSSMLVLPSTSKMNASWEKIEDLDGIHDYLPPINIIKVMDDDDASGSSSSQEPHDYLDLIGEPTDILTVNADVQVYAEQKPTDENTENSSIQNDYVSLCTSENLSGHDDNDRKGVYTPLCNTKSVSLEKLQAIEILSSQEKPENEEIIEDEMIHYNTPQMQDNVQQNSQEETNICSGNAEKDSSQCIIEVKSSCSENNAETAQDQLANMNSQEDTQNSEADENATDIKSIKTEGDESKEPAKTDDNEYVSLNTTRSSVDTDINHTESAIMDNIKCNGTKIAEGPCECPTQHKRGSFADGESRQSNEINQDEDHNDELKMSDAMSASQKADE